MRDVRIGIVGCGHAARVHLERLRAIDGVEIVGFADTDLAMARAMAGSVPPCADHHELIRMHHPNAIAIFTPHLSHYRTAMDAIQAGCHVFVEKPLSTNVQEAVDIVTIAKARGRKVGVGHQYRLLPGLQAARERLASGAIGPVRLANATLALPWLARHGGAENSWRFDPKVAGGGILTDAGVHLIDALLWTAGQAAVEVTALQGRLDSGSDVIDVAAIRMGNGTLATLGLSGHSTVNLFELTFLGESGRIRVTEDRLIQESGVPGVEAEVIPLSPPMESIDGNFVAAIRDEGSLCCPAEEALDTVRLLDAIVRSATIGQVIRLG